LRASPLRRSRERARVPRSRRPSCVVAPISASFNLHWSKSILNSIFIIKSFFRIRRGAGRRNAHARDQEVLVSSPRRRADNRASAHRILSDSRRSPSWTWVRNSPDRRRTPPFSRHTSLPALKGAGPGADSLFASASDADLLRQRRDLRLGALAVLTPRSWSSEAPTFRPPPSGAARQAATASANSRTTIDRSCVPSRFRKGDGAPPMNSVCLS
jgi:hypothetical protein